MAKCIYKHDEKCCQSTSAFFGKRVSENTCNVCCLKQEKAEKGEKVQIQELVTEAISLLAVPVDPQKGVVFIEKERYIQAIEKLAETLKI